LAQAVELKFRRPVRYPLHCSMPFVSAAARPPADGFAALATSDFEGGQFIDASSVEGASPPGHRGWHRVAGIIGGSSMLVVAGLAFSSKGAVPSKAGEMQGIVTLEEVACSTPGENCLETKCCVAGGAKGYKCYKKGENWGECYDAGNCTKGVHKGETEGDWDQNGVFRKAEWSCDAVGEASKPACWSYGSEQCPEDRCAVHSKECFQKCNTLPGAGACWQGGNCMWTGDKCEDGCWLVKDKTDCSALDRCQWLVKGANSSSCGLACHIHGGEPDCPQGDKCMWNGLGCVHDPCSAPGEDCRTTKCCSVSRGGVGMKCTEKMEYWATCMDHFNKTAMPSWSGEVLGVRAMEHGQAAEESNAEPMKPLCSWAGKECSPSKKCCNKGFTCNRKDDTTAYCVQAVTVSTWDEQPVPLPEGWNGEKLGDWADEYQVQGVAEGEPMAGTSFYCIMAVVPNSPEMELLKTAQQNNASIFQCNATSVYRAWQTGASSWDTAETTVVNTAVFLNVMQQVKEDKLYLNYDWTIKVDADCVFFVDRLRAHLWALRPPADTPMYVKNNHLQGLGNSGFLGAIEVFSKEAMKKFMDNAQECGQYLGTDAGEDGFFKGCMDAIGVGFIWDMNMFKPNFDPATCTNGMYAAYHPIKFPSHWQRCIDLATGKICAGLDYDCGGALDPDVNSLNPQR